MIDSVFFAFGDGSDAGLDFDYDVSGGSQHNVN